MNTIPLQIYNALEDGDFKEKIYQKTVYFSFMHKKNDEAKRAGLPVPFPQALEPTVTVPRKVLTDMVDKLQSLLDGRSDNHA